MRTHSAEWHSVQVEWVLRSRTEIGRWDTPNTWGVRAQAEFLLSETAFLFQVADGEAALDPEINLIVLWDVNRGSFANLKLVLACPKSGCNTRESVEAYWYRDLLHPAYVATAAFAQSAGDGAVDLDITDLPNQATGSDNGTK